jgi:3-oxoacyl-[acyl-carrier-protein] synthase-3
MSSPIRARIEAIDCALPDRVVTNDDLAAVFDDCPAERLHAKTGIAERRLVAEGECASDLAVAAAARLFASGACDPGSIDFLLFCTQTPDYLLPTTACLLQQRLGLSQNVGALDFNLGCSGWVYGLSLAKGLIETGQCRKALLLTADTYSRLIHPRDRSARVLFGDAGAATVIAATNGDGALSDSELLGPFVFGTDGSGGEHLIVPSSGMRGRADPEEAVEEVDEDGNVRTKRNLHMNGAEIFAFTLRVVPRTVSALLARAGLTIDQVDRFVFHQANGYMLEHLRRRLAIPREKFHVALERTGNTVSATIPIALKDALDTGRLAPGDLVMVVGFGVGLSWAAALIRWG